MKSINWFFGTLLGVAFVLLGVVWKARQVEQTYIPPTDTSLANKWYKCRDTMDRNSQACYDAAVVTNVLLKYKSDQELLEYQNGLGQAVITLSIIDLGYGN